MGKTRHMSYTAIVAGSTGLIGRQLIEQLCADPDCSRIVALVRRAGKFDYPKVAELVVDYDRLGDYAEDIRGDVVFSCLGTTRKQTPDQKAYFVIDHDYPLHLAQLASANGIPQFHLISSVGANARSSTFYIRLKGQTEQDIATVPFPSGHLYRPSFLDGDRKESRFWEKTGLAVFKVINPLLRGRLRKYRSINARDIATAMLRQFKSATPGIHYYESDEIQRLADGN